MCSNYEQQLPRVQEQLMKDLSEKEMVIDKLRAENEKVKVRDTTLLLVCSLPRNFLIFRLML